jgi:hypothetical protein
MAKFHREDSFLKPTGVYDIFLDVNKLPSVPKLPSDDTYIIEAKYVNRLDLLAFDQYGSTRLWWIIALRNIDIIKDPTRDVTAGLEIYLPSKNTAERLAG